MVANLLIEAVKKKIEDAVKDYRLPVKNGERRCPNVFTFDLPPKRSNDFDDFPFIIVRPEKGNSDREASEMSVAIIIGCYAEDRTAGADCLNILEHLKIALYEMPNGTLENKYVLQDSIDWNLYTDSLSQYAQLDMFTVWAFRVAEMLDETEA